MNRRFFDPNPVVLAHRGDSAFFPENTLPAFLSAQELSVDVIETDVHLSRDGEVVIWHDETLDRTTNGSGKIEDHSLRKLRTFDAGFSFSRDGGKSYPFRGEGIGLLTLKEALRELPGMRFNVDLKTPGKDLADEFADIVISAGALDRVLCASFHTESLVYMRRTYPQICTGLARREVRRLLMLQKLHLPIRKKAIPGAVFQVPVQQDGQRIVTPNFIRRFHALGVFIQVWTINDRTEMVRLLNMGVDGIFTDNPRMLIETVRKIEEEPPSIKLSGSSGGSDGD